MTAESDTLLKLRVSELRSEVDDVMQFSSTATMAQFHQFEGRIEQITECNNQLFKLKEKVILYNSTVDADKALNFRKDFNHITDGLATIRGKFYRLREERLDKKAIAQPKSNVSSVSSNQAAALPVPPLAIPIFSGNIQDFNNFYALFQSGVDENPAYSNKQKLAYLKSYLQGEALKHVNDFELEDQNYPLALQALKARYSDPRLQAEHYLAQLFTFKGQNQSSSEVAASNKNIVAAIKKLKVNDLSDYLLFSICFRNLSTQMQSGFNKQHKKGIPTTTELFEFLTGLAKEDELQQIQTGSNPVKKKVFVQKTDMDSVEQSRNVNCLYCKFNDHKIYKCPGFLKLNVDERFKFVKGNSLCINCFSGYHKTRACESRKCSHCSKKHNSLLCKAAHSQAGSMVGQSPAEGDFKKVSEPPGHNKVVKEGNQPPPQQGKLFSGHVAHYSNMILGTCYIFLQDSAGNLVPVRAILDPGSTVTLVCKPIAESLGLPVSKCQGQIDGVAGQSSTFHGALEFAFKSRFAGGEFFKTQAAIIDSITDYVPNQPLPLSVMQRFVHLPLADAKFGEPLPISVLLGVDIFANILSDQRPHILNDKPIALYTKLGYVIFGSIDPSNFNKPSCLFLTDSELSKQIERFSRLEEVPHRVHQAPEHKSLEEHFLQTFSRTESGHYVVRIPFKDIPPDIGNNFTSAKANFLNLERRLAKDPNLKAQYVDFFRDYVARGHCVPTESAPRYVMPQQLVVKPERSSTKLRVVLNCSAKSDNGKSLNDNIFAGPKLQKDLTLILISFRLFKITVCADIKKMYRQIYIQEEDREFFQFYFRETPQQPLKLYNMTVLPFGLNVSPWLALRVINQLTFEYGNFFPLAQQAMDDYRYVDDVTSGSDTVQGAIQLKKQLEDISKKGGFELQKWASNSSEFLQTVEDKSKEPLVSFGDSTGVKVLGLQYDTNADCFQFKLKPFAGPITKRNILSFISSTYDPMGLVGTLTFTMKHFMQRLWVEGTGWDEPPSQEFQDDWIKFTESFKSVPTISVPRLIINENCTLKFVGFSDASEKGCSAVVYVQSELQGRFFTSLVASKTRVAPLKNVTLPKLELNGMVLLVKLVNYLQGSSLYEKITETHLFSDSMIALNWIQTPPYKIETFVANRVAFIQESTQDYTWRHVKSEENPADLACRPQLPHQLINNKFWFQGPDFLGTSSSAWDSNVEHIDVMQLPGIKQKKLQVFAQTVHSSYDFYKNFQTVSKYSVLVRGYARVFRVRDKLKDKSISFSAGLSTEEIKRAEDFIIKQAQAEYFAEDIKLLQQNKLPSKKILKYAPFIDENGFLRAKGRLENSSLKTSQKYPLILHKKCHVTRLIIESYHLKFFHAGIKVLNAMLSTRFLILSSVALIRRCIYKCDRCTLMRGQTVQPPMGNLPKERFLEGRAFLNISTDFAGPFSVKDTSLRKARVTKGYLCNFVCMSTRAVHLEFVSDLSTDGFLCALDRFTARRGLPSYMYSDNGSNYVGANNQIKEVTDFLNANKDEIFSSLATRGIKWEFAPPAAPNFNGLAEAAVKSAKTLFYKQIGKEVLTFEQYTSFFCRVEMILNSRPLVTYGTTGDDFNYLAPSHAIIGDYLFAVPQRDLSDSLNLRDQFHRVLALHHSFWRRWSSEYLNTLIQRGKWHKSARNIEVGDLVYIKHENIHPLSWPLGRVNNVMPGKDAVVRVAEVRTQSGTYLRPVNKLVLLDLSSD